MFFNWGFAVIFELKDVATMINIPVTAGTDDAWEVRVHMNASSWPKEMALQLRRTGDGDGGGALEGGLSYVPIGESDIFFFSGSGDRMAIPIRYEISGISLSVPSGRYSAVITYTVVDL